LRFYIGFDATAPTLHLSHAKNLMLLEDFRKLGHEAIILFGDFTARIGDPTGEGTARKQLSRENVLENIEAWKKQIAPIVDFNDTENPVQVRFNHDWLADLSFEEVVLLASNFTVQQMLTRDMFERRMKAGEPIYLHEFFYPLMQGYDSVELDADVELCGTDQIFNALSGRTLLKRLKGKEKYVVAVTLMEDPATGELMSKSRGTGVFLNSSPDDMFGKVMSQSDTMISPLFTHCTRIPMEKIAALESEMEDGSSNPRDVKLGLAREIVRIFYGKEAAASAEKNFITTVSRGEVPKEIPKSRPEYEMRETLETFIARTGLAKSKTDARRKIGQGGVSIDKEKLADPMLLLDVSVHGGKVLRVGKRGFIRILC